MIDRDLLQMLVCPVCNTLLVEKGEALKCGTCKRVYPIKDDIAVLLVDQATTDPS